MKIQDIVLLTVFVGIIAGRRVRFLLYLSIMFLLFAMPLFHFWIFFTGQKLVLYAWLFVFVYTLISLVQSKTNNIEHTKKGKE